MSEAGKNLMRAAYSVLEGIDETALAPEQMLEIKLVPTPMKRVLDLFAELDIPCELRQERSRFDLLLSGKKDAETWVTLRFWLDGRFEKVVSWP